MAPVLPPATIIVYQDDQAVAVWAGLAEVRREYEPIDVEYGSYRFYGHTGLRLVPSFTKPVQRHPILGSIATVGGGEYTLLPGSERDATELRALVAEAARLEDNPWFPTLADLAAYLQTMP